MRSSASLSRRLITVIRSDQRFLRLLKLGAFLFATWVPESAGATRCDCRPEFDVYAEADGVCELTRDDKKWCEIRFNSSTGTGPRQAEFIDTVAKTGVKISDNVKASQRLNTLLPESWGKDAVEEDLVTLLAVALWERAPERIKPISELVRKEAARILDLMKMHPSKVEQFTADRYLVTTSRGCIDIDDKVFAVMIKTRFSEALNRCVPKR